YENAPTGVAMVLTGVLSKMGVYGFVRLLLPLFPNEVRIIGPWMLALAICSIVFAPLAAWAQSDLKRMVAYLSINHLGYCMLGLFAVATATAARPLVETQAALSGVFMQIFNHGITAAALFYFVGLLEQRRGRRDVGDYSHHTCRFGDPHSPPVPYHHLQLRRCADGAVVCLMCDHDLPWVAHASRRNELPVRFCPFVTRQKVAMAWTPLPARETRA